jgi:predicted membrane GTPase involved in stress response
MGNIQSMLSKMGMSGLGGLGGGKVNTAAMEAQLNQRLKMAKTKERIRAKAEANAKAKEKEMVSMKEQPAMSIEETLKFIGEGEKVERTPRSAKPPQSNNKKKKNKK